MGECGAGGAYDREKIRTDSEPALPSGNSHPPHPQFVDVMCTIALLLNCLYFLSQGLSSLTAKVLLCCR